MKTLIAVDPGLSGGVAVSAFGVAGCRPMPATGGDLVALLRGIKVSSDKSGVETICVMEATSGYVGRAQPASAAYRFGENAGFLKGVVQALGMRLVMVRPQVWQKSFGLGTASACASKTIWKNKLKAEAQRRFPHLEVTLKTSDALLILEYALGRGFNHTDGHGFWGRRARRATPYQEQTTTKQHTNETHRIRH
ncbi:MAG TPA: hypothetical protein P5205_09380 [Candidatus Paceibacterota bacterium]|nr:hypothetical protein [Verrucomicrobiota bacterium]HSA10568.1 hypothetical protein [Candidatus Paceibacterota bacterium]